MKELLLISNGLDANDIKNIFIEVFAKFKGNAKAVIIPTASEEWKSEQKGAVATRDFLLEIGYKVVDFLDVEFEDPKKLHEYQVIYLSGGNPFYLLYHLKKSGAVQVLREVYEKGTLIVGGSAGAVVFGPDLQIVSHFAPEYKLDILTDNSALACVPFSVLPHANRYRDQDRYFDKRIADLSELLDYEILLIDDGTGIFMQDDKIIFL